MQNVEYCHPGYTHAPRIRQRPIVGGERRKLTAHCVTDSERIRHVLSTVGGGDTRRPTAAHARPASSHKRPEMRAVTGRTSSVLPRSYSLTHSLSHSISLCSTAASARQSRSHCRGKLSVNSPRWSGEARPPNVFDVLLGRIAHTHVAWSVCVCVGHAEVPCKKG